LKNKDKAGEVLNHDTLSRRSVVSGIAGVGAVSALLIQGDETFAMADKVEEKINQTVSEHARAESLPKDAYDLPRWVPSVTGDFDLTTTRDNYYAWAKAVQNISGGYRYLGNYGWICICPPGEPAFPFLGRISLVESFVTPIKYADVDGAGPDDYVSWATATTTHVDPRTFEPVSRVRNPYTGDMIDVPTFNFADQLSYRMGKSIVVPGVDPKFYDQPWDREGGYSQHYIDAGQTVSYTVLGAAQKPGPMQPRLDTNFFTVNRAELMNPNKRDIEATRSYSSIQKMSEYAWYGAKQGDQAQLHTHMTGIKTTDPARLPDLVKKHIIERNKGRFQI
jgi:hypothetical protein